MWFCIWFGQVFLLATNVMSMSNNEDVAVDVEMGTDVIKKISKAKNISKLTNVLQDLMKKQEQFGEINKYQGLDDDSDSDDLEVSTDTEVEEQPELNSNIFNKKADDKKHVSSQPGFHITRMLMASEENESSSDSESNRNEIASVEKTTPKMGIIDKNYPNNNEEPTSPSSSEEESSSPEKEPNKNPKVYKPKEIVFDNSHKVIASSPASKPVKPKVENSIGLKTRYKLIEHRREDSDSQSDSDSPSSFKPEPIMKASIQPRYLNPNIRKVIRTETFSQGKIWDDITNNTPINLKEQEDKANFRSKPKTALVIITGSNSQTNKDKSEKDSALESELENEAINKEIFKSKILRQAYGDACLKVAIRKCYKACLAANKQVCSGKNCKSSFKEKFKQNAKTGCLKEFQDTDKIKTKFSDELFDITRQGHMAACLPMVKTSPPENETSLVSIPTTDTNGKNLNILRDRYEKARQKVAREKCNSACNYALKETCTVYECPKGRKKSFERACNRHCKISYRTVRTKGSSSSSSSSSSSDSSSS